MFIVKFVCSFGIFLNSANLICRSTDISKCFRGSLRLRDNESRLYFIFQQFKSNRFSRFFCSWAYIKNCLTLRIMNNHETENVQLNAIIATRISLRIKPTS